MPELPEVETIRRQLAPRVASRVIVSAAAHPSSKFQPAIEASGAAIDSVRRRGKYLLFALDDDRELIIHLGMTGQLSVSRDSRFVDDATALDEHVRAVFRFDNATTLVFRDVRRFGRLRVVEAHDYETIPTLRDLGPEPLGDDFTPLGFHAAIARSSRRIKTQLLSQRPVAGVGNIYADEALWQARVNPASRRLSRPQAARLHDALREILAAAVANNGTTLRDYRTADGAEGDNQHHLRCYGRGGEACLRCGEPLRARVIDARTTTWCATCQRR